MCCITRVRISNEMTAYLETTYPLRYKHQASAIDCIPTKRICIQRIVFK